MSPFHLGLESNTITSHSQDYTYSLLDAFVPLPGDETAYCRCKRGPQVKYKILSQYCAIAFTVIIIFRANQALKGEQVRKAIRDSEGRVDLKEIKDLSTSYFFY